MTTNYIRNLDKGESIKATPSRTTKEWSVGQGSSFKVDHPNGEILITLLEKTGRRARISVECSTDFNLEHVGQVRPK